MAVLHSMAAAYAERAYASAADMRASYRAMRARLMSPLKPTPAGAAAPDVVAPQCDAPQIAEPAAAPPVAAPETLADIVATVCAEIGLAREALMFDIVSDLAVDARKIAAALATRRLPLERHEVVQAFGMIEAAFDAAVTRVDKTLIARAIPANADLAATVRLVIADWELSHDLRPSIPDIKRAVCAAFRITRADLESARRPNDVVRPRQLAMALARRLTARSLPEIGRHFGGRDHTTVMHAVRKMQPLIAAAARRVNEPASVEDWVAAAMAAMAAKQ